MPPRRALLACLLALPLLACKRDPSASPAAPEGRCAHCGMKLDPKSAWIAELVAEDGTKRTFDAPRCALAARLAWKGPPPALRVHDFYDRVLRDGSEVRFVVGSDVLGPMGPDLVPVDAARAPKFMKDHQGERALGLADITQATLEGLR